jgi:pre-rRNA-processing protein TSR2
MSLPITGARQQSPLLNEFRAGVTACLRSWSPLKHAVEAGWGGVDSVQKADELRQIIIDHIENRKLSDPIDLEDNLAIYMEEEFSLQLEDGSEKQVAECIWEMHEQCCRGETTLVQQVIKSSEEAAVIAQAFPSQVQSNEDDDEDDDDDDDDDMNVDDDVRDDEAPKNAPTSLDQLSDLASQSLFGKVKQVSLPVNQPPVRQLGEAAPQPTTTEADEEGFAPVAKGRRKARS